MRIFHDKLRRGVAVFLKLPPGKLNSDAKSLHISQIFHRFGQMGIAIVRYPWSAEVLPVYLTEGTSGVLNLDTVGEPGDANGGVCPFIGPMQNGISGQLLQGDDGIIGLAYLNGLGSDIRGNRYVYLQGVVEDPEEVWKRPVNLLLVLDWVY